MPSTNRNVADCRFVNSLSVFLGLITVTAKENVVDFPSLGGSSFLHDCALLRRQRWNTLRCLLSALFSAQKMIAITVLFRTGFVNSRLGLCWRIFIEESRVKCFRIPCSPMPQRTGFSSAAGDVEIFPFRSSHIIAKSRHKVSERRYPLSRYWCVS